MIQPKVEAVVKGGMDWEGKEERAGKRGRYTKKEKGK